MSVQRDPNAVHRYLDELRRHLSRLPDAERDDAVREIESHIADACASGMPLMVVLARLGEAYALARAYEADFLLRQPLAEPTEEPVLDEGRIVRIVGPVVDVQFAPEHAPEIHHALEVELADGSVLVLEVQQLLGNNMVRCVAMGATDGLPRGLAVHNTEGPINVPVGQATLGRVLDVLGHP